MRDKFQLNTHGIALKSLSVLLPVLRAGLEPILLFSNTSIQVALP
jgi:hypothetical protein